MIHTSKFIHMFTFLTVICLSTTTAKPKSARNIASKSQQELATIELHSIDLNKASLSESLNYLISRARELDTTTLTPCIKGVSITHIASPHSRSLTITYKATNVSFITAITQIAIKAKNDLYITSTGIVLSPPGIPPYPNEIANKGAIWNTLYLHKK